jgi:hypothetical protein
MARVTRTSAERRMARKLKEQQRTHRGPAGPDQPDTSSDRESLVRHLVIRAAATTDEWELDQVVAELGHLEPDVDARGHAALLLVGVLRQLWEAGWQPADVAHVTRRWGSARIGRLLVGGIAEEARSSGAATRAPEDWTAQLSALGALTGAEPTVVASWWRSEGLPPAEAWGDALRLIGLLGDLGGLHLLAPPPSRWGKQRADRTRAVPDAAAQADARVLGRIRALLAKAESTEFPDEADALSAKAQELMTRHAVDAALLDAAHGTAATGQVRARRVHIDNPYAESKVHLLDAVARVNAVRCIWLQKLGMATLVGLPADLESVDLLFTSLLVQATRAMAETGRAGTGRSRSATFRRAFLASYAVRIRERLDQARTHATEEASRARGTDLVPVLKRREQAVDDVFADMFPETRGVTSRSFDAGGWHAGRLAAEHADIGWTRGQISR